MKYSNSHITLIWRAHRVSRTGNYNILSSMMAVFLGH
jgi:hypothetical protein